LVKNLYVNIGKDKFYPAYNGRIAKFRMNLCGGAYDPDFKESPNPPPTPTKSSATTVPPPSSTTPEPTKEPEPRCVEG
jgi:hypothetical protein